jgi:hypothetical protein
MDATGVSPPVSRQRMSASGRTRGTGRAVAGTAVAALAWAILAAARPTTTWHLAAALVVWAYPYLLLAGAPRSRRPSIVVLPGAIAAAALGWALHAAGLLAGPVVVGRDAFEESLIVTGAAAFVGAAFAFASPASRDRLPSRGRPGAMCGDPPRRDRAVEAPRRTTR